MSFRAMQFRCERDGRYERRTAARHAPLGSAWTTPTTVTGISVPRDAAVDDGVVVTVPPSSSTRRRRSADGNEPWLDDAHCGECDQLRPIVTRQQQQRPPIEPSPYDDVFGNSEAEDDLLLTADAADDPAASSPLESDNSIALLTARSAEEDATATTFFSTVVRDERLSFTTASVCHSATTSSDSCFTHYHSSFTARPSDWSATPQPPPTIEMGSGNGGGGPNNILHSINPSTIASDLATCSAAGAAQLPVAIATQTQTTRSSVATTIPWTVCYRSHPVPLAPGVTRATKGCCGGPIVRFLRMRTMIIIIILLPSTTSRT